jgi:hypothetical protein
MVADLREVQENQWFSEIRIDKSRLILYKCCVKMRYGKRMVLAVPNKIRR